MEVLVAKSRWLWIIVNNSWSRVQKWPSNSFQHTAPYWGLECIEAWNPPPLQGDKTKAPGTLYPSSLFALAPSCWYLHYYLQSVFCAAYTKCSGCSTSWWSGPWEDISYFNCHRLPDGACSASTKKTTIATYNLYALYCFSLHPIPSDFISTFLGESLVLPNHPHLIIVPETLLGQWESELRVLLKPGFVDIFTFAGGKDIKKIFWDPFNMLLHSCNRIIIAPHLVSRYCSDAPIPILTQGFIVGYLQRFQKTLLSTYCILQMPTMVPTSAHIYSCRKPSRNTLQPQIFDNYYRQSP